MAASATEQLDRLKNRIETLNARRQRAQVQLEAARQQYTDAVREAKEAYGTADVAELRALLAKQEEENTQSLKEFAHAVEEFDRFITKIEEALANPEVLAAMVAAMPALQESVPAAATATTSTPVDEDI